MHEPQISGQFLKAEMMSSSKGLFLVYLRDSKVVDGLTVRSFDLCMKDLKKKKTVVIYANVSAAFIHLSTFSLLFPYHKETK